MKYVSTRGQAPAVGFMDALLTGLAPDGGLYLPDNWPQLEPAEIEAFRNVSYEEAALEVMARFTGTDFARQELHEVITQAYAGFRHLEKAPLVEIGPNLHLLELFHGPTLAFKDFAMQILARLMDRALTRTGRRATIAGATSGDTGAAAVEAFKGLQEIEVFVLFPHGRISDVQRRQMTTAPEANIHALAIKGSFDDAQAIVKALFNDAAFKARHNLSAINSINWARIMAQAVYYFTAAVKLGAPQRRVSFAVPTGNFGDIFAGYAACRMGLPVSRLVIATNENDILARALATGSYEPRGVISTSSPSMDIQISSNFERLLFEASGRDSGFVHNCMTKLTQDGRFNIPMPVLSAMRQLFSAYSATVEEARRATAGLYESTGMTIDPHTAVGLACAERYRHETGKDDLTVVLGTAHPAKFPAAAEKALGQKADMPESLRQILTAEERFDILPNDTAAVADFIDRHAGAASV